MRTRHRIVSLAAVICSMMVTTLSYAVSVPLLARELDSWQVAPWMIGLNTAAQGMAVFAILPFSARLLRRHGPARLMLAGMATTIVCFVLLPRWPNLPAWFVIRFMMGAAGALLWMSGEVWINTLATDRTRGRVVSIYYIAAGLGMMLGPLLLALLSGNGVDGLLGSDAMRAVIGDGGIVHRLLATLLTPLDFLEGMDPYTTTAIVVAISAIPTALALPLAPSLGGEPSAPMWKFLLLAPAPLLLNLIFASEAEALLAFLPILGDELGLDPVTPLMLLVSMSLGGMLFQLPFGWLVDHMNRYLLTILCCLTLTMMLVALPRVLVLPQYSVVFMLVYGGLASALGAFSVVLLGDRFRGADLAAAGALYAIMWNVGTITGPPLAGAGMDLLGPSGMSWALALLFVLYLPFPVREFVTMKRR